MLKTTDDCFKKGDTIGLYLQFSGKKGRLTIYKNNANVDLGFE